MKKLISLFLIICMLSGLLSGCIFNRVSSEENIINMQVGGYLYTSQVRAETRDERLFLKAREKAVDSMLKYMENAAKDSFDLTDGFEKYESNLRNFMNKIDKPASSDSQILTEILEKIIVYKVLMESLEDEIRKYMKMKPDSIAARAIISTYMVDSICRLIDIQNEYASWLIPNTATVYTILETENERQADKLLSSSSTSYAKHIYTNLSKIQEDYEAGAVIHSAILSGDYYVLQTYLDNAAASIDLMNTGKSKVEISPDILSELELILEQTQAGVSKPPVLLPVPEDKTTFSFSRRVSAREELPEGFGMSANLLNYYTSLSASDMVDETMPVPDKTVFIKKFEEKQQEVRETPGKKVENINIRPVTESEKTKNTGLLSSAADKATQAAGSILTFFVDTGINLIVKSAQTNIKDNFTGLSAQYAAIIDKLAEHIASGEKIKASNQTESVMNLLKNDLASLLGGNKDTFVNMILNSNADELIDTFDVWKDQLKDGDKHIYTKDDLIDLLAIMGIKATVVDIKEPGDSPQAQSSDTPSATASSEPVEPNLPTESTETENNFGIAHITGNWQTIRELDPYLDNESIIYTIYGWTDLLDYSQYEKNEITDKNGKIIKIQYLDKNNNAVGWETRFYDNGIEYSYHFPDNRDYDFEIIRVGTLEKSYMYQVSTEDETIDRMTSVRFNEPGHPETEENIKIMTQRENGKRDGLNLTAYNSNPTYAVFDMEDPKAKAYLQRSNRANQRNSNRIRSAI